MDWSDASEARQAAELMQQWAPIDVADALELLSPDFVNEEVGRRGGGGRARWVLWAERCVVLCCCLGVWTMFSCRQRRLLCSTAAGAPQLPLLIHLLPGRAPCRPAPPQVRSHAVEVLQKTDDEELLYYLLQLVQVGGVRCLWQAGLPSLHARKHCLGKIKLRPRLSAATMHPSRRHCASTHPHTTLQALRYESCDDSRLARFLVGRAHRSVTLACFLFWYLCTELDDPVFGPRASYVQVRRGGQGGKENRKS